MKLTLGTPDKTAIAKFPYVIFYAYFIIDYVRPQDVIPGFGYLKPGFFLIIALALLLIPRAKLVDWRAPQIRLVIAFAILLTLLIAFARNSFRAYSTARNIWITIPVIAAIMLLLNSQKSLRRFFHSQGLITIYLSGYVFLHGGRGPGSFLSDENDISLYFDMMIPLYIFLFNTAKDTKERLLSAIYIGLAFAGIVISFSRGGFVGLVCVGAVYWWYSHRKLKMLMLVAAISLLAVVAVDDAYWQEMSTITDTEDRTGAERQLSWKAGWYMFLDNPLGVGGGNFNVNFGDYQLEGMTRNMWGRAAHSIWFTLLPETGVLGSLIYCSLILVAYRDSNGIRRLKLGDRRRDEEAQELGTAFLAAMAGFFSAASFISVLYYPHFWYLSALIYAARKHGFAVESPPAPLPRESSRPSPFRPAGRTEGILTKASP